MRTEGAASERNVISETELPSIKLDDSLEQPGRSPIDFDGVEVAPNREKLRRAAVQRGLEHLQRGNHIGLLLLECVFDGVYDCVTRERRMIADMPRQIRKQKLQSRLVVVKPDHVLADFGAVRGDGIPETFVAQIEVGLEILFVECEARAINKLFNRDSVGLHLQDSFHDSLLLVATAATIRSSDRR